MSKNSNILKESIQEKEEYLKGEMNCSNLVRIIKIIKIHLKSKSLNNNLQEIIEMNDALVHQDRHRPYQRVNILQVKILNSIQKIIQKIINHLCGSLVTMIACRWDLFK